MAYHNNKETDPSKTAVRYKKKHSDKRNTQRDFSLRSFFMMTVFGTFCIVVFLSGLVIAGCAAFRHWLLPDANAAYLTVENTSEDGTTISSTHLLTFGEATKLPMIVTESEGPVTEENSVIPGVQTEITEESDALRIERSEFMPDATSTYSIQKLVSSF